MRYLLVFSPAQGWSPLRILQESAQFPNVPSGTFVDYNVMELAPPLTAISGD